MKHKKKKKKVNSQHTRQSRQATFNHFCKKMHHYLKLIECEELTELFDKESCSLIFNIRNANLPKIRFASGVDIKGESKKLLAAEFDHMISNKKIPINDHISLSAKEVIQYLDLINSLIKHKEKGDFDINTTRLIQIYKEKIPDFASAFNNAIYEIAFCEQKLGLYMSRMNSSIRWLKYLNRPEGDEDRKYVLEVREHIPKKRVMIIDGHPRPVFPVSLAYNTEGPKDIFIPSWRIRLGKDSDKPLGKPEIPVYFQNHLLHRLEERLDCIPPEIIQFWLFSNLDKPKFNYFQGKRLVEFRVGDNTKLGYIVLELHEGRFVAKTFLLLTNSGTPEGEKLKEMSGMQMSDLKYWAIDKLSTFQSSDLKDHPKTKALFYQAGCGSLFEDLSSPESIKGISCFTKAKQILRYIEGAKEHEELQVAV